MDIKDIKVGETYNVRVRVGRIDTNRFVCQPLNQDGTPSDFCPNYFNFAEAEAFHPAEPAPKYDPCRKFRKGDKVQVKKRDGRCNGKDGEYLREAFCTVAEDETQNELVRVLHNATEYRLAPAYLELVTPVEEVESFGVRYSTDRDCAEVYHRRHKNTVAVFYRKCGITREQAEAHAEAERDRLNDERRKEQGND